MLIARTALRFQRATLTILGAGFVAVENVSRLVLVPPFVTQMLAAGTGVLIVLGIIDEDRRGKASGAGGVFLRAAFAQTADLVHSVPSHGFDASAIGEICIG
jgi:hypothetical protein